LAEKLGRRLDSIRGAVERWRGAKGGGEFTGKKSRKRGAPKAKNNPGVFFVKAIAP